MYSATRMAKKLNASFKITNFNLDETFCDENQDVYLWDWELGFVHIENPCMYLGKAILTAISDNDANYLDFRSETHRFSHVCIHDKNKDVLYFDKQHFSVDGVRNWENEFDFKSNQGDYENANIHGFHV